ncbi:MULTISPECIES: hypothetical protein [unclassified Viridibacillus]|uniref:hypothetical protein n=1 Tax=unclassified Viridibacillus TaxID=2617942 RepID=UPI00096FB332|nr:hypothetical protein [Viridibacillus sp. FSL H7-0596]OMC83183.1 hypothetical protein BK128_18865 [Viridibacillus sp. FSL H7-0596]
MKKRIKKVLVSLGMASVLLVGGVTTTSVAPKQTEAAGFEVFKYKSGYFTNYVDSKNYYEKWSSTSKIALLNGSIKSSSSASGTYKVYIQIKKNNKGSWKTIKTINAKKNGTTKFESPKFSDNDGYRFHLVNQGTKKKITYDLSWAPWGYK